MAVDLRNFYEEAREEYYQVLTPDGKCRHDDHRIDKQAMMDMFKYMLTCRIFDEKALILQRQGRIGTYASFKGQEACQVGGVLPLRSTDWLFPTYRDHGAMYTHGQTWKQIFLYWMGHMDGSITPEDKKIIPPAVPIATQLLHAVGTAWADKLDGKDNVSLVYFGDGATSEGDFHEALNFAGVYQTPTVFLCQNNGYAISVPFEKQSASKTIAQRGKAYDIEGIRIDGNDIFAVYLTVKQAIEKARRGEGPTLIEAVTTRFGSHTTADDAKKYRDQQAIEKEWAKNEDPLARLRLYLKNNDLLTDSEEKQWTEEMRKEIDEQFKEAENYPRPTVEQMFEHVYKEKTWTIAKQEKEFLQHLGKGGRSS